MKRKGERIVGATAHDVVSGRLGDAAGLDFVVVGDSTAITVLGHDSVIPSTVDQIILFCQATVLTCVRPLVVADMPFGSYHVSDEDAVRNAVRFIKEGGADAVKCDSTLLPVPKMALRIRAIVDAGIATMAHLTSHLGNACRAEDAKELYEGALALEAAGSFAVMLECVPGPVADVITKALRVPTLGYGCGAGCDGQDVGFFEAVGYFVGPQDSHMKTYGNLYADAKAALEAYAAEVRDGTFPQAKHTVTIDEKELARFEASLGG
jgi:3-methyl-2-oxobutanoate hydroxymethyltransferase